MYSIECTDCKIALEVKWSKVKRCRSCQKIYLTDWKRKYGRKYRQEHIKQYQENLRRWQQENPDKVAVLNKKWRSENPEKFLIAKRKSRNGMTDDQFQDFLQKQNNSCAICLEPFIKTPRIDHDHLCCVSEKSCGLCTRGLLCHHCNIMLGNAKDNPEILERGAAYLRRYKE